ncbi:hypothetical protein VE01_07721 [Pseudogymnoascus verrucosus]|uniref:Myb-like domain-containing protein n=1 Tax=Pseudogymnoascus verrucosus TaxID=342668 RepID=A0A1B8GER2_9PEZI|nr:uncharacterized protein VE01_07721 [Pseudogymnoascus verrucosus]OBT94314.1 hypothetical protein VE01_07721 [Pseudogymnoascus verrucosus]
MPSPWTPEADRDLLLAIIDENKLQGLDWRVIAAKMATKNENYSFSHEGCRQHFQKLRKASNTGANGSVPSTPRTPKTPKTPASRKPKQLDNNVDDEEAEDFATPSKKRKRDVVKEDQENGGFKEINGIAFGGQTAAQFKMESLSGEEEFVDLDEE